MTEHHKSLISLGLPIIIGNIGTIILNFADTFMIGRHSIEELAAASFVNTIFIMVIIFSLGFSYGITPIVGNLFGRGERGRAGVILKNSLASNALLGAIIIPIMTLLYLYIDRLGQPEELLPLIRPYYTVSLMSLPFILWFNCFKQFADGITDTKISMWIMLSGNVLNIIGNYILIYGVLGFPELGLLGAGISTLCSRACMALAFTLCFFCSNKYKSYRKGFTGGRVNKADFTRLNTLGWPLAFQMGMETAAFSLSGVMVGWIGTMELAAHQIMLTISQLFYMIYYGMAAAVAVRVSYFNGQHDYLSLNKSVKAGLNIIFFIAACVAVPVFLTRHTIGYVFTDNETVCLLVAEVIIPMIVYQFGDGLQCNYANALRGLSEVRPLMFVAFISYFIISLPLGYVLGIVLGYGLTGIWFAFPFGLTVAGILYYMFFRRKMNRLVSACPD